MKVELIYNSVHTFCPSTFIWKDLDNLLKVRDKNWFWQVKRYKGWDGYTHFFKNGRFMSGLIYLVIEYLKQKEIPYAVSGNIPKKIEYSDLKLGKIELRDYQKQAIQTACKYRRGILELATNSGKSEIAAALIKEIDEPALILVHKKVLLENFYDRLAEHYKEKIGRISADTIDIRKYTVGMVQTLYNCYKSKEIQEYFGQVKILILEECVVAGTKISTPQQSINIEDVKINDYVYSMHGINKVKRVFKIKKDINCLRTIKFSNNTEIICSKEHPFLTENGWVKAENLMLTDSICFAMHSTTKKEKLGNGKLQSMWQKVQEAIENKPILFKKLLSKITRTTREGTKKKKIRKLQYLRYNVPKKVCKTKVLLTSMRTQLNGNTKATLRKNENKKSNGKTSIKKQDDRNKKSKQHLRFNKKLPKRKWPLNTTTNFTFKRVRLGNRSSNKNIRKNRFGLPFQLQGRCWEHRIKNSNRGRRTITLWEKKATGQEKRNETKTVRVESITFQKQRYLREFRNSISSDKQNGKQYITLYDLEVESSHTYFANGILVHNCHRASATSWFKLASEIKAPYRYGLSGTPLKNDLLADMRLTAVTGRVLMTLKNKYLIKKGFSAVPEVRIINNKIINLSSTYMDAYKRHIVSNLDRNVSIKKICEKHTKKILILVRELHHGEILRDIIKDSVFVFGENKESIPLIKDFSTGKIKILISTSILDEGVDIKGINVLVLAVGMKDRIGLLQRIGRGLRKKDDGSKIIIYDFEDFGNKYLRDHAKNRQKVYKEEGFKVTKDYIIE